MLRFLETWTGVKAPNVTNWRRSVTGDLTAAFDFANGSLILTEAGAKRRASLHIVRGDEGLQALDPAIGEIAQAEGLFVLDDAAQADAVREV